MPKGHGWFEIVCRNVDEDDRALAAIADQAMAIVSDRLTIDPAGVDPVRVFVGDGPASVVDREIRVGPLSSGRGYSRLDRFELIFSHELAHLLMQDAWGRGPVLWWEGLPVHLGDDRVRTRLFGHSYHAYCRALDRLDALLPLASLIQASTFYRRRRDIRVDLQAGSFCGFLLATHGPRRLQSFLSSYRPPTPAQPRIVLNPLLLQHLGDDLAGLSDAWLRFLRTQVATDAALLDRLGARSFGTEPDSAEHCDFCFAPRTQNGTCRCLPDGPPPRDPHDS